jgi:HK97 family phage major capsid protein
MESNKQLMEKADIAVSDLIADGGYLQPEQATAFIVNLIKQSVVLSMIDVRALRSHTQLIDKVGINGRVLRPGVSGAALAAADRAKPTTDQTTLNTVLMKGEIRLNDEVLEDNIEGGNFKQTVMDMMAEHVGIDMEDLAVNGDTLSADPLLALQDGMLKTASVHVVDAGNVYISKTHFKDAIKAMPSQWNRNKASHVFLTSEDCETDFRDYLADRATPLGDQQVQGDAPLRPYNRPLIPVPVFPDNIGTGSHCTNVLLTDPKNARWGIWRRVRVETDRDITSGEWIMVVTVRAGFQWRERDAVVKVINVRTN